MLHNNKCVILLNPYSNTITAKEKITQAVYDDSLGVYKSKTVSHKYGIKTEAGTMNYSIPVAHTFPANVRPTAIAAHYAAKLAPVMAYISVKQIYVNRAEENIRRIMNQCLYYSMHGYNGGEKAIDSISHAQKATTHDKAYINLCGKRTRIEIIPYTTLDITDDAKEAYDTDNDVSQKKCYTFDADDVVDVAYLAILELIQYGYITNESDIWEYRNYVFASVNRYIHGEKRHEAWAEPTIVFGIYDENDSTPDNTVAVTDDMANMMLTAVQDKTLLDTAEKFIIDNINIINSDPYYRVKNESKKKLAILAYFSHNAGYSIEELSQWLNLSQRRISAMITAVKNTVHSDKFMDEIIKPAIGGIDISTERAKAERAIKAIKSAKRIKSIPQDTEKAKEIKKRFADMEEAATIERAKADKRTSAILKDVSQHHQQYKSDTECVEELESMLLSHM